MVVGSGAWGGGLSMGLSKQIDFHAYVIRVNPKIAVTELPKNGSRTQVPTRPRERRIAIHIFGIDFRSNIQKKLDGFFGSECCSAVEGSFGFRSAIAHEATCFSRCFCRAIWIRFSSKLHLHPWNQRRFLSKQGRTQGLSVRRQCGPKYYFSCGRDEEMILSNDQLTYCEERRSEQLRGAS